MEIEIKLLLNTETQSIKSYFDLNLNACLVASALGNLADMLFDRAYEKLMIENPGITEYELEELVLSMTMGDLLRPGDTIEKYDDYIKHINNINNDHKEDNPKPKTTRRHRLNKK